jgi:septum formation protein
MTSQSIPIILASASPRRELLLREMGLRFRVIAPTDTEELMTGAAPEVLALQNAQRKARAVAGRHPDAMVIGADTVVVLDGTLFGKPRDLAEAGTMLGRLAGRQHVVVTGVCLIHRALDTELTFADHTRVWMKPLTAEQIAVYHARSNPLDKAGAYAAQEFGASIIDRLEGSFTNVMGLPTERLQATFERIGFLRGR